MRTKKCDRPLFYTDQWCSSLWELTRTWAFFCVIIIRKNEGRISKPIMSTGQRTLGRLSPCPAVPHPRSLGPSSNSTDQASGVVSISMCNTCFFQKQAWLSMSLSFFRTFRSNYGLRMEGRQSEVCACDNYLTEVLAAPWEAEPQRTVGTCSDETHGVRQGYAGRLPSSGLREKTGPFPPKANGNDTGQDTSDTSSSGRYNSNKLGCQESFAGGVCASVTER